MGFDTETILDRRNLKRSLSLWRVVAIVAGVAALGAIGISATGGLPENRQIARVSVEGIITENRDQLALLKRVAEADHVKGVILFVNSSGGTTTGGEALFEALRRLSEKKPVVAQFGTVAASAAYIAGLGTDHIVARGNTITGSVGVIMQWPEVSELLAKIGVKMNEVKSGPLKANPSPFQPIDEAGRKLTEQMIMDGQRWFLSLVASRRNVSTAEIPGLEQGRIFSGREAQTFKLVDEIGGEIEAVRWLEDKRNVPKSLKVVDWKPRSATALPWFGAFAGWLLGTLGLSDDRLDLLTSGESALGRLALDGLVSVWHPAKN
jgi:protease-4